MYKKKIALILLISSIVIGVVIGRYQKKQVAVSINHLPQSSRYVYLGLWSGGFWDNNTKKLNINPVSDFEQKVGKKMAIVNIYSEWSYLSNKNLLVTLNTLSGHGWVPMVSTNPYFFEGCPENKKSLYRTIADGDCDRFLKTVANTLHLYGKPLLLRFAWEMNLPNMYWSVKKTQSTPEDFIRAWRHIHSIMRKEGADNIKWVLSYNTSNSNTIPYISLYPGDEYVDWVAIDGYNWGNTHDWSGWADFNGVFRHSYDELIAITDKPVMLSEVNSAPTGTGGDKAQWLRDMLDEQIPNKFPNIEAIVFFDEDKTKDENVNWRMDISPFYLSTLKNSFKNSLYKSSFP